MKLLPKFFIFLLAFVLLAVSAGRAQDHKGWSRKAKGAAIGGGSGAVVGGLIGGRKGVLIGAAAGAVGGGLIVRHQDKKKNPVRYNAYRNRK